MGLHLSNFEVTFLLSFCVKAIEVAERVPMLKHSYEEGERHVLTSSALEPLKLQGFISPSPVEPAEPWS